MSEVAKDGETELSQAEKEAIAEEFKAKRRAYVERLQQKATTAQTDGKVVPIQLDMTLGPKAEKKAAEAKRPGRARSRPQRHSFHRSDSRAPSIGRRRDEGCAS